MFIITNLNRKYEIQMRSAYKSTIRSEKKLITVLKQSAEAYIRDGSTKLGESILQKINDGKILEVCNYFGIINYSRHIEN